MSQDIRNFFSKTKVKLRYDCNTLSEQRKERKDRIEKGPKQKTIESLGRVIIIEEFNRCKGILSEENVSQERLMETFKSLLSKTPSRKILKETKLGHIINNYRKHEDPDVKAIARKTYTKWKVFIRDHENLKPIEVRYDKKTEEFRENVRKQIVRRFRKHLVDEDLDQDEETTLQLEENSEIYATAIEQEALRVHKRLISKPYRKHMRRIVLRLDQDIELVEAIISGEKDAPWIVNETLNAKKNAEVGALLYNENKLDPDPKVVPDRKSKSK